MEVIELPNCDSLPFLENEIYANLFHIKKDYVQSSNLDNCFWEVGIPSGAKRIEEIRVMWYPFIEGTTFIEDKEGLKPGEVGRGMSATSSTVIHAGNVGQVVRLLQVRGGKDVISLRVVDLDP